MTLTNDELTELLDRLLADGENEVVEFKEAARQFPLDKTGEYVAALSNEANLRGVQSAWLVFGVSDSRKIVGTTHLEDAGSRQKLKHRINESTDPSLTVKEIHEVTHSGKRVVLLEIPAAPRGIPISWKGDYRARAGESLVPLSLDKLDEIRRQSSDTDWTAVPLPNATLEYLDPEAIMRAREGFTERYPRLSEDVQGWDDWTFLSKIRLIIDGKITRAAVILLGKFTSSHLLSPHMAEMSWKLTGPESAYQHFGLPFLMSASDLADRIRNVQIRLLPPNELIYREISKYDQRSLLEAIYNCIAHQDYSRMSRIIVIERVDRVEFISVGSFFDRAPEDYMVAELVPRGYRNPVLVEAMTELNLIDHMGNGIHRMVEDQVRRFLPLPDYDLSDPSEVSLTIHGAVIDDAYTQLLMVRPDLPLEDVLALDRVQKGLSISEQAVARLRQARLVEGRRPHLFVSSRVAAATGGKAAYIRTRSQDDAHYARLVLDFLEKFGHASRQDIDELLGKYLQEDLQPKQRREKVTNVLRRLRVDGVIRNAGTRPQPRWELT